MSAPIDPSRKVTLIGYVNPHRRGTDGSLGPMSYASVFPLHSEKAKSEYAKGIVSAQRRKGIAGGALLGGTMGSLIGLSGSGARLRQMATQTLAGGTIGALGGASAFGILGHLRGKQMGQQAAATGKGFSWGHNSPSDATDVARKYLDLNKQASSGGALMENNAFFLGFEKQAGITASMLEGASKGNMAAVANTMKRMKPKLPPGSVDLGKYWNEAVKTVPKWKESLQRA